MRMTETGMCCCALGRSFSDVDLVSDLPLDVPQL